jgi:hypothetical protein
MTVMRPTRQGHAVSEAENDPPRSSDQCILPLQVGNANMFRHAERDEQRGERRDWTSRALSDVGRPIEAVIVKRQRAGEDVGTGRSPILPAPTDEFFRPAASLTQRKPRVPARSLLGAISSSLPC